MARAMVVQSVRLAMVRSMRMLQNVRERASMACALQSLRACKLSFPYACTAVATLRQSELGEVLGITNEL